MADYSENVATRERQPGDRVLDSASGVEVRFDDLLIDADDLVNDDQYFVDFMERTSIAQARKVISYLEGLKREHQKRERKMTHAIDMARQILLVASQEGQEEEKVGLATSTERG